MDHSVMSDVLLTFWFGGAADDAEVARQQGHIWWAKNAEADRLIADRFGNTLALAANGAATEWPKTPRGRLARIIALDQLPRNIYRGKADAFAWDLLAQRHAQAALEAGDESQLRPIERVFLYMPFEHAENLACQELAVERFDRLCGQVPLSWRPVFQDYLNYAVRHRDIIRRFGRFPHRNIVLGRLSTVEEVAFLREPGSSF